MSGPALVFLMITIMSFGVVLFMYLGSIARKQEKPAIAVLPFQNLSSEPDNQYFADGLTIEVIDALTRIESLRVVSWNSVSRFRGKAGSLGELRSQLNAAAVLDGSVRKENGRVRVTAQLVDTAKGTTLWSQNWEREPKDVFRIQEELAKSIVYGLRVQMSADPSQVLIAGASSNPEAYNNYLRARYHRNNLSTQTVLRNSRTTGSASRVSGPLADRDADPCSLELSSDYARKAIEQDPNYAPAYALLASNLVTGGYSRSILPAETVAQGKQLSMKAIALDPRSAEGHAALGLALSVGEWKFQEAGQHFLKAIEINPGSADAHAAYALGYLLPLARLAEAEFEVKHAVQLDPLSFWSNTLAGYIMLQTAGREAESIQYYDKALEIYPKFTATVWDRGMALAFAGKRDAALAEFRKCAELTQIPGWTPGPAEWSLLGDNEKAIQEAKEQIRLDPVEAARAYALVGETDLALEKLEQALKDGNRQMMFVKVDRRLSSLRGNPRFQVVVKKVGLEN